MRSFKAANPPVLYDGGLFYARKSFATYRFVAANDWEAVPETFDRIARDVLAIKVVWRVAAAFATAFDLLQTHPTRDGWKTCTCHLPSTSNVCLGHSLQPQLNRVTSWLPMQASAYQSRLPLCYNTTKTDSDLWLVGCLFHRQMKKEIPEDEHPGSTGHAMLGKPRTCRMIAITCTPRPN